MEDIKEKAEQIVEKVKANPALLKKFKEDPTAALKEVSGIDIPAEQVKPVVQAVTAKLAEGNAKDILGKLF